MRTSFRFAAVIPLVLAVVAGFRAQVHSQELLLLNRVALDVARDADRTGRAGTAVRALLAEADNVLQAPLVSVVQKRHLPPSGDRHDYMSLGPYWWPDPTKPDGLPYIRRDGEVNPEYRTFGDNERIGTMVGNVETLALAYAITREERYAQRAVRQVSYWFLEDSTRMNPHLEYAQAIRGVNRGRGIGIIETYGFRHLVDALSILARSASWSPEIQKGVSAWLTSYLTWLQESPNGKDEAGWKNNHGSAYDVQAVCIALFLGKQESARRILDEVGTKRIAVQVEPDGSQPLELERTKSWDYSVMNLDALVELGILGDRLGCDLWNFRTADGRGIRAALDYLLPYATGKFAWTRTQIVPFKRERLHFALSWAAFRFNDSTYATAASALSTDSLRTSRESFRIPTQR
jgi:hypothetical protein